MKRIVSHGVAEYVGAKIGAVVSEPYTSLGIERDGELIAGVVFNCFTGFDIEVTAAGERGAFTRPFLRRIGRYVFEELGCERMSFTTQQESVIALAVRLGAQTEGRKRNYFGKGQDAIVMGLLKEDWKV